MLAEIERIATAPRAHGVVTGRGRAPALGWAWWAMFVVGWVFTTVATLLGAAEHPFESADDIRAARRFVHAEAAALALIPLFAAFIPRIYAV